MAARAISNAGTNVTGSGTLSVTGATVNVNNLLEIGTTGSAVSVSSGALNVNTALSIDTLSLSGGTIGGTEAVTVAETFNARATAS